ncbi:hypothetical protein EDC18_101145 [Natranaerovirga pectinivora]|uniref:Cell division protein FtsL n=1 Tax=Natranaerovirga pectinivora TaxID=682400 RepID=A0A4V2V0L9_9FIRM|nr:hypothetical protein [Natranaerovirga pectinivora]TCT16849.1 hypothetical protein EDC18_101145 [Natranaerovirga pectinivora]
MEVRRGEKNRKYYVDGNLARPLHVVEEKVQHSNVFVEKRKLRKRNNYLGYKITLTCTILMTLFMCVFYLSKELSVSSQRNLIVRLENQYKQIVNENDMLIGHTMPKWDLDEIYVIATNELGMIHPAGEQVIFYNQESVSYMKQFAQVPMEEQQQNQLTNLVGFMFKGW